MQIENYRPEWKERLYDIDIKSYRWPWAMISWNNLRGYVFRCLPLGEGRVRIPRGFSCFKIKEDVLEVFKLCVHPDSRRMGLGTRLLDDLIHIAVGQRKRKMRMVVHEENEYLAWAECRGWKGTGVIGDLFPDGTDGYIDCGGGRCGSGRSASLFRFAGSDRR